MIEPLYLDLLQRAGEIQGSDYGIGHRIIRTYLRELLDQTLGKEEFAGPIAAMAEQHLGDGDIGEIAWVLETLRSSGPEVIVGDTLQACVQVLPAKDPRVLILPGNVKDDLTQRMNGIVGFTPHPGLILLFVAPRGAWDQWLPYVLMREYHHSARLIWFPWEHMGNHLRFGDGRPFTLLDNMIYEGLADVFTQSAFPSMRPPWTRMARDEESTAWKRLRPRLGQSRLSQIRTAMFGDGIAIPHWAGYVIGYWIVQGFRVRYPSATQEDLLHMDARTIFQESGLSK